MSSDTEILHQRVQNQRDEVDRAFPTLRNISDGSVYHATGGAIQDREDSAVLQFSHSTF